MEEIILKVASVWRYVSVFCQAYNSLNLIKVTYQNAERLNRLESGVTSLADMLPCPDEQQEMSAHE